MAGDAVRLGANVLVPPFPIGHLAMFAHPLGQLGDALRGTAQGHALQQLAAVALTTGVSCVGNEITGDFLGDGRINTGVIPEVRIKFTHHALP